MNSLLNELKSLAIALMALLFFVAVTVSSCTGTSKDQGSENTESVEATTVSDSEEHPEGEEHPADSAATAAAGEEHPEGDTEASAEAKVEE